MIEFISKNVADWLWKQDVINEDEKQLYEYATYCFLLTFVPLCLTFAVSVIVGKGVSYIFMITSFVFLRKYCGGYHTKKAISCLVASTIAICIFIIILFFDTGGMLHWLFVFLASLFVVKNSPIENENHRLKQEEKLLYKKKSLILLTFIIIASVLLQISGFTEYSMSLGLGIILVFISQVPIYIMKIKRNKETSYGKQSL